MKSWKVTDFIVSCSPIVRQLGLIVSHYMRCFSVVFLTKQHLRQCLLVSIKVPLLLPQLQQ